VAGERAGGLAMSEHRATIRWQRDGGDFVHGRYSREHTWSFDGGATIAASPSPSIVRPPYSNPAGVDPEEAFVAAISSCHMLVFLYLAAQRGYDVEAYEDDAVGNMTKNEDGVLWVSTVKLSPRVTYRGDRTPTESEARQLHEEAHHGCFIANSVKTKISVV
jgi:organic hydroperoxide reductase OsmC/OhrA